MGVLERFLRQKYPDYDSTRYRFKFGDVVRLEDDAVVLIKFSAMTWVRAFVLKPSFKYSRRMFYDIPYAELPLYKVDEFIPQDLAPTRRLRWHVGDVVPLNEINGKALLVEEHEKQAFYALVLESDSTYYRETTVYVQSPIYDYEHAVS